MGRPTPKQFLALGGQPLLVHSLRILDASRLISHIIVAVAEADREYCLTHIVDPYGFRKVTKIVPGGAQRQDSVRHALAAVEQDVDLVLVHDAVRPFPTVEMVEAVLQQASRIGGAIVALPMRDTVKMVGEDGCVQQTMDRRNLWLAQTPQAFRFKLLQEVHRKAQLEGIHATDDAQLLERFGHPVGVVEGNGENIKITRPEDLAIGEAILASRARG